MKSITVAQLRQNPTEMLDDVAAGETYKVTRHRREIARIVPVDSDIELIPPSAPGAPAWLSSRGMRCALRRPSTSC